MSFIDALFACINFAIFIALVWYLFKRYGQKPLYDAMEQYQAVMPTLEREKKDLIQQEKNSIIAEEQQEHLAEILQKKITTWQRNIQIQHQEQQSRYEQIYRQIQQQQQEQQQYYTKITVQKAVIPHALEQAHKELYSRTQTTALSQKWLTTILDALGQQEIS